MSNLLHPRGVNGWREDKGGGEGKLEHVKENLFHLSLPPFSLITTDKRKSFPNVGYRSKHGYLSADHFVHDLPL